MNAIIISETIKKQYNMKKIIYSVLMLATMACTFTSCEDVPLPYGWPFVSDGGGGETPEVPADAVGTGTADDPFNVAAALALINQLGADVNSEDVYTKGIITAISEVSPNFGNATFKISDTEDADNELTVYRAKYLDNKNFSSEDQIKIGDEVVIFGKLVNFRGNTPEYTQGCYIYSLNGSGGGGGGGSEGTPSGSGTLADPFNAMGAVKYAQSLGADVESPNDVYIKGKVASITNNYVADNYGNATFYISDDGKDENTFYCFRVLYLNNQKYTSGDLLKIGDEVVICGKVVNYKGNTPETVGNKAYLHSLNSSGGGGGDNPPSGDAKGDGTEANPYNAVAANNAASALPSGGESEEVYVAGIISSVKEVSPQYGNATYYISDDGKTDNQFYIFRGKYLEGADFTSADQIKVGDKVVVKGKLLNYMGNTPEFAQGNYIVKLEPGEGGGGGSDTPGPGGEVSGNSITVTMSSFGLANATDAGTLTLTDGTTLAFAGGENTNNSPKYYDGGGGAVRMYAKNTLTISAQKAITKVVITCTDPASGTVYNGNDMMYGEAGGKRVTVKKDSDTQVTFSDFSNKSLFICNDYTEAKAGTQLRILKIVITYAE